MKRILTLVAFLGILLPATALGNEMIAVGKKAPQLALPDADQKSFSLEQQIKKGPLVLVFYRSGNW